MGEQFSPELQVWFQSHFSCNSAQAKGHGCFTNRGILALVQSDFKDVISLNGALTFNNNNAMNNLKRESFSFAGNMKEKLFISQALEKMKGITVGMTNCRLLRRLRFSLYLQNKSITAEGLSIPHRPQECPGRMGEGAPHPVVPWSWAEPCHRWNC